MKASRHFLALAAVGLLGISSTAAAQDAPPKKPAKAAPAKAAPAKAAPAKAAPAKAAPAKAAPAKAAPAKAAPKNGTKNPPAASPAGLKSPFSGQTVAAPIPAGKAASLLTPFTEAIAPVPFDGMLGVMVGNMTPQRRSAAGAPREYGLLVNKVLPGTVASVAGVQKDDVIIDVGGGPVRHVSDVGSALSELNVGDLLTLQVIRNQKPLTLFATLTPMKKAVSTATLRRAPAPKGSASATLDGAFHFVELRPCIPRAEECPRKPGRRRFGH